MKASDCIRHDKPRFRFYGTAEGKKKWRKARDELRLRSAAQMISLAPQRTRDLKDRLDDQREHELTVRSLEHVEHVLRNFEVIEPATTADIVDIGVVVTYREYDQQGNPCKPVTVQVGEYGADDINVRPRIMSYDNRLLLQLMGSSKGDCKMVRLADNRESEFEILDIRLPTAPPELKLAS